MKDLIKLWSIMTMILLMILAILFKNNQIMLKKLNEKQYYLIELKGYVAELQKANDSLFIENSLLNEHFYAYVSFRDVLGHSESSNNPYIVNTIYAMGKYQFMRNTAKILGYDLNPSLVDVDTTHFPELNQDMAFNRWVELLEDRIYNMGLDGYIGKTINDSVIITKSGMIAAAHLSGPGGIRDYLISEGRLNYSDGNTTVNDYIYKFGGYNF
jgi:hypothetical protein